MRKISEMVKAGLFLAVLAMTMATVVHNAVWAEVTCEPDTGDECVLSSGDILKDQDEVDIVLE